MLLLPFVKQHMFKLSQEAIVDIFEMLSAAYPEHAINSKERWGYLKQYMTSDFTALVTIMLASVTRAKRVVPVCEELFKQVRTPQDVLALSHEQLVELIKGVGDSARKAHNLQAMCQQLVDKHGGAVPNDKEALLALKGVGTITASIVLSQVFNNPDLPLDADCHRVLARVGLVNTANIKIASAEANVRVPDEYKHNGHEWLGQHGREICTKYAPFCEGCCLADTCRYYVTGATIM